MPVPINSTGILRAATAEAERLVAWLRVLAVALIGLGQTVVHQPPAEGGFLWAIGAASVWAVALLTWVYRRPITSRLVVASTAGDITAITVLAVLSGGAFSQARLAYFLIPISVAFRFRPLATAAASAVAVTAYVSQALLDPAISLPDAEEFVAIQAGYLAWVGVAATALALVLARRTRAADELAATRQRLMADVVSAGERERRRLADGLHDHAIQNLLSARHELQEVAENTPGHPALHRVDATLAETVQQLRDTVFELHPYVLEQAGLDAALHALGQRAAARGGFDLELDLEPGAGERHASILVAAARELLANVAQHACARTVQLRLAEEAGSVTLAVTDDGHGFDPGLNRVADGHIGLAAQRERVSTVGGALEVVSAPGRGTRAIVRLPA